MGRTTEDFVLGPGAPKTPEPGDRPVGRSYTPAGFAPSNVDDLPLVACAECGSPQIHWIPPEQQMSDVLDGLVGCASCNIAFVLESPFAPGAPMARIAPNPNAGSGASVACPKCGAREIGLMPRTSWKEDAAVLSVAFGCRACKSVFYQETL